MMTDADLVRRARAGDAAAYDELTERHLDAAYGVALALLGSPDDAEDCCQDAFVVALERLDQCRSPERFGGWLIRIVRNRALNQKRSSRVRAGVAAEPDATPASTDPARELDRVRLRERLTRSIARLTEAQRRVVMLHDLEGWSHGEIAELLGISPGASRALLFKARSSLRALLDDLSPHGDHDGRRTH